MLSSEFSLAGEFIFCKGWEANGLKTGVEMPEQWDSLSVVSGLPHGNRVRCPEGWPCNDNGAEEEFVEGLKFPLLPPCCKSGRLKSGAAACVAPWAPDRDKTPSSLSSSLLGHQADVLRDKPPAPHSKIRR